MSRFVSLLAAAVAVSAQDPAQGWLGYAKAVSPTGAGRISYIEATWVNGGNPKQGGAFYSPWFGIETSDNLNLFQPVNPWVGNSWEIYNEYFQWLPEHNENSRSGTVKPGDVLYGNVTLSADGKSYTAYHSSSNGFSVSMTIPIQADNSGKLKDYTIAYFVFEKAANCAQYPPEGSVTFRDILIKWEGTEQQPTWTTGIVDDVCNNRAHILNSTTVQITWNSQGEDPAPELIAAHAQVGLQRRA